MFNLDDIETIEGREDATPLELALALQRAINSSLWSLQGSYGRTMMAAIESGDCLLGRAPAKDYWGNRIPSRTEVQAGTKGSPEFVLEAHDEEWLKAVLEA